MMRPLNVIYLHTHDTGRHIAPYGYPVHTPSLDKLAAQSLLFRQAYCAAPTCSPSRAALLTGQCAHSAGMLGLHHRGFHLKDPSQHLATVLKNAGCRTTLIGVNHVHEDPLALGYEQSLPIPSCHAADVAPAAEAFLRSHPAQPFFLDIGFVETHRGRFTAPDAADNPDYLHPPSALPDTSQTRLDYASFATAARRFDQGAGRILDTLAQTGLDQHTLLVVTTDHGISFPRHKCTLFDGGIGVLLMMRGPATHCLPSGIPAGAVTDALVSQVDLVPTLCEYLDLSPPPWLQGHSLLPILRDPAAAVREEIFAEINYHAAYQPERCIRTRRYKYIRRFGAWPYQPLSNLDDGISKRLYVDHGWGQTPQPAEALYDLFFDPLENCNLLTVRDHPHPEQVEQIARDLRSRLENWMRDTDDPLLHGPPPTPPGAVVNRDEDYSASDVFSRPSGKGADHAI